MPMIELDVKNFPQLKSLMMGRPVKLMVVANAVNRMTTSDSDKVVFEVQEVGAEQDPVSRFDRLTEIMNNVVDDDGRLKVTTQTQPLGNT